MALGWPSVLDERLQAAGLDVRGDVRERLVAYLTLLGRWNRVINLTSHDLSVPSAGAIDRLIVEPVQAARLIPKDHRSLLDVGSGGGSPAVPIALHNPVLRLTMVESRERKASFLREAIRVLGLDASVEGRRFEDVSSEPGRRGSVDTVSLRAVRLDASILNGVDRVLAADGILLALGCGPVGDTRFVCTPFSGGVLARKCLVK